jgi:hypothetical protein
MTPQDLAAFMDKHRFSQSDIAWLTGKNKRTVQFWLAGRHPVPQMAYMICCAVNDDRLDLDWIVHVVKEFKGETE